MFMTSIKILFLRYILKLIGKIMCDFLRFEYIIFNKKYLEISFKSNSIYVNLIKFSFDFYRSEIKCSLIIDENIGVL